MQRILLALAASLAFSAPAFATDYLKGYVGAYDVSQGDDSAAEAGIEYVYQDIYYGLRPLAGIMVTSDSAVYGYAGAQWDLFLSDSIILSPNFVAGAYSQGDGKDLGHALEFKSGIELAYQFEAGERVGVAFNHISNASIGDDNPGTENLILTYSHPLNWAE
ncbi:MAG: acyloxyacyl hydrolase [Alphaproteobacteria bacterium]|nr:acyloxyacyl hydrolase [Alphaproteobacteria bacterium]